MGLASGEEAGPVGDFSEPRRTRNTQRKLPIRVKHMDKHTDTHICAYDTHVDRMKDGKNSALNKSHVTWTKLFYPSGSNVGSFNSDGIQKEQQEISFIKQNKKGKKNPHVPLHTC